MTEWILSSSILILIVIGLRTLFKGKISLRLQYVIWGLVLLRLLLPVNFGSSRISVEKSMVIPTTFHRSLRIIPPPPDSSPPGGWF